MGSKFSVASLLSTVQVNVSMSAFISIANILLIIDPDHSVLGDGGVG
jgi:hypothetical protein